MLEGCDFSRRQRRTQLGILSLLDVSEQLLLSLTALEGTILLGVHSQLEEFLVVLSVVPAILIHLLLEAIKRIGDKGMWIGIGKLTTLLLSQFDEFRSDSARHLAALAENHTPDGVVHHHIATLALLHSQQVHQGYVLGVLRERCHQWGITYAGPYILYLVKQLHQHVIHRECGLALLLTQLVNHGLDRTEVGHHRTHHTTRQTTAQQE